MIEMFNKRTDTTETLIFHWMKNELTDSNVSWFKSKPHGSVNNFELVKSVLST